MHPGLIGGILGGVIGLAGGLAGAWCSIRNTNGPRERAFMIRLSILFWGVLSVLLALLFVLETPYRFLVWVPFSIFLPLAIVYGNRRQAAIRREEAEANAAETAEHRKHRPGLPELPAGS
ncbi:MAG: hypothetical protein ACOCX4_06800 [Planctomycetota bacterium]